MKTKSWPKLLLLFLAVVVVVVLLTRRDPPAPVTAAPSSPSPEVRARLKALNAAMRAEMASDPAVSTNTPPASEAVLQALSKSINQFIAQARPFGADTAIRPEDITWVKANNYGRSHLAETKTDLYEVWGERVASFMSHAEGTDTRRDTNAPSRWYQATAPWTKEEALKETYAIMGRLGLKATEANLEKGGDRESVEYEATPTRAKTPAGEIVTVTPFHNVWLHFTNGAVNAEYRMGSSGPGRLVRWFTTLP